MPRCRPRWSSRSEPGPIPLSNPALRAEPLQPPTAPSAESEATSHPDASIPGGQHRPDHRGEQSLFLREHQRDRQVMKTVQSTQGGDPKVPFTVFENIAHRVSRKAGRFGEQFGAPLMHTRKAATEHGDPSYTVPVIAEPPHIIVGKTRRRGGWLDASIREARNSSSLRGDQKRAVIVLAQRADAARVIGNRIEMRTVGHPSP